MTGLAEEAGEDLKEEVEAIYLAGGARVRWLEEASSDEGPHVARVYVMDELPRSLDVRIRAFGGDPMAFALGSVGKVSGPVIYVSRAAVSRNVSGGAAAEPEPATMGQALGRVVAHELAHRFLQRKHTRRGILTAELTGADLAGHRDVFFFTPHQRGQLQDVSRGRREHFETPSR